MSDQNLAKHLASRHADGMAVSRPLADNQEAHEHEHRGPGTIRDHDPEDLSWDQERLDQVVRELAEDDPYFYYPDAILADPHAHPLHKVHAMINIGVRDRGEQWAKCPNCGEPYQITEEWSNPTVCSDRCAREFTASLGDPGAF